LGKTKTIQVKTPFMKVISILFAIFCMISSVCAQVHDHDQDEMICKEAMQFTQMTEARSAENLDDANFDVKYNRFTWAIDPAVKAISGIVTTHFEVKKEALTSLELNLSTLLVIDSIVYHGQLLTFVQTGSYGLRINLPQPLALASLDSIAITYHGVPPTTGFGSFNKASHAGIPILWTLSCPFGTQDWWPCKNGLTDKIDSIDIIITTPSQYRAASIGTLVAEISSGTTTAYHWQHRYPIVPYLVAFSVTNYTQYTDNVPLASGIQMPMVNYVYPESLNAAKAGTANLVQVLQFYDSLFASYPFAREKYGHAQFGWGGGMEHQTMSFVTDFSWSLLAHELAHQWFGDMVTCGSWEDAWLNEGSATYLEGLTQERFQPATTWFNWKKSKVINIAAGSGGSVRVDDTTSVNRIFSSRLTYNKGAYLLHMLRWKVGDTAFFTGLRAYLADRQYGFAKTASIKAHLELSSGIDLTEFFQDWYIGQGHPKYQLQWSQNASNTVQIKLNQTPSHSSVSFFEMPVPVRFSGQGQSTTLRLDHTFSGQEFTENLPFAVTAVAIDPDYWLVSSGNTITQLVVNVHDIPSPALTLRLQPNPVTTDRTNMTLVAPHAGMAVVSVSTMDGKIVQTQTQTLSVGENQIDMDTHTLPAGIYLVRVQTQTNTAEVRLVKI
jgi:aminopeptidase N